MGVGNATMGLQVRLELKNIYFLFPSSDLCFCTVPEQFRFAAGLFVFVTLSGWTLSVTKSLPASLPFFFFFF
jgi:hypothetical protein